MASTGTYISAVGHAGFVGWLILGWGLSAEPLPFEVSEVSVVSGAEYARLVAATTPNPGDADPTAPAVPQTEDTAAPPPPTPDDAPAQNAPDAAPAPSGDTPPPDAPVPPEPIAPIPDDVPVLPDAPAAPAAGAIDLLPSDRPQERPTERVAPEAVAPPPDDVAPADIQQDSAAESVEAPAETVEDPVEETAPEETATTVVPEDVAPSGAVETSVRPSARPNRPTPAPQTEGTTTTASSENAVDDAVAAALESAAAPDVPAGPRMDESERAGFRVSVQSCWNVGALSSAAQRVTVTVAFSLGRDKRVAGNQITLVTASGGDSGAIQNAFDVARRAVLQCQVRNGGFQLPDEKFDRWQDVELTFDPSGMRMR